MKHLEINGVNIPLAKGTSDITVNRENLGKIIIEALPNNMEQYREYVCNIKLSIDIYGTDGNELEVLKDYEEVTIND